MEPNDSGSSENSKRDRASTSDSSPNSDGGASCSKKSRLSVSNGVPESSTCSNSEAESAFENDEQSSTNPQLDSDLTMSTVDDVLIICPDRDEEIENDVFSSSSSDESEHSTLDPDDSIYSDEFPSYDADRRREMDKTAMEELKEIKEKEKPKHKWNPVKELQQRQLGHSSHIPGCKNFRRRFYDSLFVPTTFQLVANLEHHTGCVNCLGFDPSGKFLASGSDDLEIVIWDWYKQKKSANYSTGHQYNVFQCEYRTDNQIVSCARDGQVRLGDIKPCGSVTTRKLAHHTRSAHKLALPEDNTNELMSSGQDSVVYHIDLRESSPHKLLAVRDERKHKIPLNSISCHPQKSYEFCVAGQNEYVHVYDRRKIDSESSGFKQKYTPPALYKNREESYITCAVYSHNGDAILSSYSNHDIYLFDANKSEPEGPLHQYGGHRNSNTVKGVSFFGPSSQYIVSGSDCGNIFLWDRETEAIVNCFRGDLNGVVNVLRPHPYEPCLATSGLDDDVKVWYPGKKDSMRSDVWSVVKNNLRRRMVDRDSTTMGIGASTLLAFFQDIGRRNHGAPRSGLLDNSSDDDSSNDEDIADFVHANTDGMSSDSDDSSSDLPCRTS